MSGHRPPLLAALLATSLLAGLPGILTAAELLGTSGLQAPVRAGPGDLLLLAGDALSADAAVTLDDLATGMRTPLEVVRAASTPRALIVRLPSDVDATRRYRLSVADAGSTPASLVVNDARPQWFGPAALPASGAPPGRARELRIVGRNFATLGSAPRVLLRGPATSTLAAIPEPAPALADYSLRVAVPALAAGDYQLAVGNGGGEWIALAATLRVYDPGADTAVFVDEERFGGCRPDDMRDDTACVLAAIEAARLAGGGTVYFSGGTWRLDDPAARELSGGDGIPLPRGVSIAGRGAQPARILRGGRWNRERAAPLFVLLGGNTVSDLRFADAVRDRTRVTPAYLRLGRRSRAGDAPRRVTDLAITRSEFAGADESIDAGGLPLRNLTITHNLFRAWRLAVALGGDASNSRDPFVIEDALIAGNRFEPGSYLDAGIGQGTRASEIGGALRLDFSDNEADGAALGGLDASEDAPGWRAAFFWHLTGPQEQLLIAGNRVSCSGDKAGDGEAIALDSNHNRFAFDGTRGVRAATAGSVDVVGPVANAAEPGGMWVQIVAGRGLGQSRRVSTVDAIAGGARFHVAPPFDVTPAVDDSRVIVTRQFWQAYVIGNLIDHRRPPCLKSNRSGPRGGAISLWASSSDSVIAGNRQFDSGGIVFQQAFARDSSIRQAFLEIRDNEITGEYDARAPASLSGIQASHGAAPDLPPPVLGFGIVIAHNHIDGAGGDGGAAIGMPLTWHRGPAPHDWPLIQQPLIFGNRIENTGTAFGIGTTAQVRGGVAFNNTCAAVRARPNVAATRLTLLCGDARASCECRSR